MRHRLIFLRPAMVGVLVLSALGLSGCDDAEDVRADTIRLACLSQDGTSEAHCSCLAQVAKDLIAQEPRAEPVLMATLTDQDEALFAAFPGVKMLSAAPLPFDFGGKAGGPSDDTAAIAQVDPTDRLAILFSLGIAVQAECGPAQP